MATQIPRGFYNVKATAGALNTTEKAVRGRIARRQIPFRKLGGRILIPIAELELYISRLPGVSASEAARNIGG
jgi:hypothetical protein